MEPKTNQGAKGTTPAPQTIKPKQPTLSERFSNKVVQEFTGNIGNVSLSDHHRRLIQNYFIATDQSLKMAEEKRLKKSENYRDAIPVTWENVNMESLAISVVACAKIGLDPSLPNHINIIPYKNNRTGKYDIGFIDGYRGKELKAKKYGYDVPDAVTIKLVYQNEKFIPIYKDKDNKVEHYIHKPAEDPFNPGEIVGGYYYHDYFTSPEKNKLMFYSLAEILKRKPEYASTEFWGGEKTKYEKDDKTGKSKKIGSETVEGWFPEMCWKTIYRMAYNAITLDSEKIDENLMRLIENETNFEMNRDPDHLEALKESRRLAIEENLGKKEVNAEAVTYEEVDPVKAPLTPKEASPEPQVSQPAGNGELPMEGPGY